MEIYKDVNMITIQKIEHYRKRVRRKLFKKSFCKEFGDIPVLYFNEKTNSNSVVDNRRGYAYALRNALRYKKAKQIKRKYKYIKD